MHQTLSSKKIWIRPARTAGVMIRSGHAATAREFETPMRCDKGKGDEDGMLA